MQQSLSTAVNVPNPNLSVDPDMLPVIEWEGLRVITTAMLAVGYETDEGNIRKNLSSNQDRFEEGKHYFLLTGSDLKEFKDRVTPGYSVGKRAKSVTLWTEKGAARMSKIVDTDKAWNFFEKLEDSYFRPASNGLPLTYEQALENLLQKVKENRLIAEQRDHAIKTKAWIGEKREATAMATASAEKRKANALAEKLGESKKHATVLAVEKKLNAKFQWQPLKKWCKENKAEIPVVHDERYGSANSYPAKAWMNVYSIDLKKVF